MTHWPRESKEKAAELLPKSVAYLCNEISLFLETVTPNFPYTETLSRVNRRIGEIEIFAEITENEYVQKLMKELIEQMSSLMHEVDIEKSKIHIRNVCWFLEEEMRDTQRYPTVIISNEIVRQ